MNAYLKVFINLTAADIGMTQLNALYGCTGLTGYAASTCHCTGEAKAYGHYNGREFRSWHSTASVDARCNILGKETNTDDCDFELLDSDGYGPWLEVGTYKKIFNSHTDLSNSELINSLQLDASGTSLGPQAAMTDTVDGGVYSGFGCDGNNASTGSVTIGLIGNNTYWTDDFSPAGTCSVVTGKIYCFEVPDL